MNRAPIAISVFDRPQHFRNCIESLKKNAGAEDTVLYISSDGPRDDRSNELVTQVREYIKTISGFKKVVVFAPKENTKKQVWFETRQRVSDDNSRFIFTEDDNVFSRFFLDYMNDGLTIFENEPRVAAVCGYNYPNFPFQKPEAIPLRCFAAWGYGTWRDKDLLSRVDMQTVSANVFSDRRLFAKINSGLPHMAPMLKKAMEGRLVAGDVTQCALIYQRNLVCIFPSKSLVRNTGFDGSGEHCGITDKYAYQEVLEAKVSFDEARSLEPIVEHDRWLRTFFGGYPGIINSWLIYWEVNAKGAIAGALIGYFRQCLALSIRASRFVYRYLKGATS